jgi:hypothetical protein
MNTSLKLMAYQLASLRRPNVQILARAVMNSPLHAGPSSKVEVTQRAVASVFAGTVTVEHVHMPEDLGSFACE